MSEPSAPRPRIVLDTNAWLDLLVFDDPRIGAIREALREARIEAVTDAACREEWRRVLDYPLLALEPDRQGSLMQVFDAVATRLETPSIATLPLPRCRDPDDQKFLELAHASDARWLVSRDKAVLKLNRRTRKAGLFAIIVPEAWLPTGDADAA